jgi:hypothetical protein
MSDPTDPDDHRPRKTLASGEIDPTDPAVSAGGWWSKQLKRWGWSLPERPKWPAALTPSVLISGSALLFTAVNAYFAFLYVRDDFQVMYSESPDLMNYGTDEDPRVDLWGRPQFVLINAGSRSIVVARITMALRTCEYDEDTSFKLFSQPIVIKAGEVQPVTITKMQHGRFSEWNEQLAGLGIISSSSYKMGDKLDVCFHFRVITTDGIKDLTLKRGEPLVVPEISDGFRVSTNDDQFLKPPVSLYRSRWPF